MVRLPAHLRECARIDDLEDTRDAERADQLAFEVGNAYVHVVEHAPEQVRFVFVAEPAHADVGSEFGDEAANRVRAADRNDRDCIRFEIATESTRDELEHELVARAFHRDQHRYSRSHRG